MTGTDSDRPDEPEDDPWQLAPRDELVTLSLNEVLDRRTELSSRFNDGDTVPVGIRVAPVGFRAILGLLAAENHTSYSGLALVASAHGLVLLSTDDRMIKLHRAFNAATRAGMTSGDRDALSRLEQESDYRFQHGQAIHTTFPVWRVIDARLVVLARACGISVARLTTVAITVSLLTLANQRKYRQGLEDEVVAFWRFVAHRERVLRLGE